MDEFTKETGIKVNILSAKSKVLIKKIIDEGKVNSGRYTLNC
jgi:ABC-type Fe3+ transport system substrate-binding protein